MPSARASELRQIAAKLGFVRARQTGSHERWRHEDGRSTTIPIHGGRDIGPALLFRILAQMGIDLDTFERMRQATRADDGESVVAINVVRSAREGRSP